MDGQETLDRVVTGARVFDGERFLTGSVVGLRGDRIAYVGRRPPAAIEETKAEGCILAPAFIDTHNHGDFHALEPGNDAASALRQGVGTAVVGNCGFSATPVADPDPVLLPPPGARNAGAEEHAARLRRGLALDVADLMGHNTLRLSVLGSPRAASLSEVMRMAALLAEHLERGGAGMSVGLNFREAGGCDERELLALCRILGRFGRPLTCHLRSQGEGLPDAVDEVARLGEKAGCPVLLSHLRPVPARFDVLLPVVLDRLGRTSSLFADLYPYTAGCARLEFFFHQGFGRLPSEDRLLPESEVDRRIGDWHPGGYDDVLVVEHRNAAWEGRSVAEIAGTEGTSGALQLQRILLADPACLCVYRRNSSEEAVEQVLRHPKCFLGSDGYLFPSSYAGFCHPRSFAAFTRFLRSFVRPGGLTLEEALSKLTRRPAAFFGLDDRGAVRPGLRANLCLFRLEALQARADFRHPSRGSAGMVEVVVGGRTAWADGRAVDPRPGSRACPTAGARAS